MKTLPASSSKALSLMRFPMIAGIVMIHCVGVVLAQTNATGWEATAVKFFGEGIARSCVPLFFAISGFFFFYGHRHDKAFYLRQWRRRARSLLVPYLAWNTIFVAWHFIRYRFLGNMFPALEAPPSTMGEIVRAIVWSWGEPGTMFYEPASAPADVPLWYVRDLMVMCLLAPLFRMLLRGKYGIAVLAGLLVCFTGGWWIHVAGFSCTGVTFFSLGAWFGINGRDPAALAGSIPRQLLPFLGALWFAILLFDVELYPAPLGCRLHAVGIIVGVTALTALASHAAKSGAGIPAILTDSSFFIYASHMALVRPVAKGVLAILSTPLVGYFLTVIAVTAICFAAYRMVAALMPPVASILTGGRLSTRSKP